MMRYIRTLMLACLCSMIGFTNGTAFADKPVLAVSIEPVRMVASQIAGDVMDVRSVLQKGQSAHYAQLKPSQVKMIADAASIIFIHPKMEVTLHRLIDDSDSRLFHLGEALENKLLPIRLWEDEHDGHDGHDGHDDHDDHKGHDDHDDHKGDDDHHDHAHEAGSPDWHFWLSPSVMAEAGKVIADRLSEASPSHSAIFQQNYQKLAVDLDKITQELKADFRDAPMAPFIAFHDATRYFEAEFGVTAAGVILIHVDEKPSAKALRDLHHLAEETALSCVFFEPEYSQKQARQIASDIGLKAVLLDPLGSQLPDEASLEDYYKAVQASFENCRS